MAGKHQFIVAAAAILIAGAGAYAGTIQADLTVDGYITENEGGSFVIDDSGPFLNMQDATSVGLTQIHTTLIEYAVNGIDPSDIIAAQLTVIYNGGGTNGTDLLGYTGTADGAVTTDDLTGGSLIQSFTNVPASPGDAMHFDVTAFVIAALSESSQLGFRFAPIGDTTQLQWRSSEYTGDYGPTLTLTLVPAPGALALLGLAGCTCRRRRR